MRKSVYSRLYSYLQEQNLDYLIATSFESILHLTGFESAAQKSNRTAQLYVILSARDGALGCVLPVAEIPTALESGMDPNHMFAYGGFIFAYGEGEMAQQAKAVREGAVEGAAQALIQAVFGAKRIGVEMGNLDASVRESLCAALPRAELLPADGAFQMARVIKDADEIQYLRRSSAIAELGIQAVCRNLCAGMSESEAVQLYNSEVVAQGAETTFAIITFGKRSAFVDTAASTSNHLQQGDMIRFDVGCRYGGYHSDMARTAVLGMPDDKLKKAYDAILQGEARAMDGLKVGVPLQDVFCIAVEETRKAGLPAYGRHHCGHGIGLYPCEYPIINALQELPVQTGMVLCVETPYYEIGWGGIQVEDTLLVTESGYELFTLSDPRLILL